MTTETKDPRLAEMIDRRDNLAHRLLYWYQQPRETPMRDEVIKVLESSIAVVNRIIGHKPRMH